MSRPDSDSFLPSGAIPSPPHFIPPPSSNISPLTSVPRSIPTSMDSYISPQNTRRSESPVCYPKPYTMQQQQPQMSHSPQPNMTPPKTRSSSTDPNSDSAALIEDWRNYTTRLRRQFDEERAHMIASQKTHDELREVERELWVSEMGILQTRIKELEKQLETTRGRESFIIRAGSRDTSMNRIIPGLAPRQSIQQAHSLNSPGSNSVSVSGSIDGLTSRSFVPQESGRNADGSCFYAPTTRNPSRTFSASETPAASLRVDDVTAPRESAIRVTSKELTSSDFGPQSPPHATPHHSALGTIPETQSSTIPESIDISLIQPELEGVTIKTSAVSPTFVAKVLSPQFSPVKLSPSIIPPGRDDESSALSRSTSQRNDSRESGKGKADLTVMMTAPVDQRLRMHAGHTPNHSVIKFDFIESGGATPIQDKSAHSHAHPEFEAPRPIDPYDGASLDESGYGDLDEDRPLRGQLGLTNDKSRDDPFLAQLTLKLAEEARKSEGVSPSSEASEESAGLGFKAQRAKALGESGEGQDEGPRLRLKPSSNFGRPLGSM